MSGQAFRLAFACLLVLSIGSCGPWKYKLYEGESLPPSEVAYLLSPSEDYAFLDLVDGQPTAAAKRGAKINWYGNPWNKAARIELLPGWHTVSVSYGQYTNHVIFPPEKWFEGGSTEVGFEAQAGKTYQIKASLKDYKMKVWVEPINQ